MSSPIFTQAERKVSELVQNAINPRTLKDKAFKELKESLDKDREFIKARPIIVSMAEGRENTVIAGNMRLQAIKSLGWATVPVVEVRDASVEQEKEWMVKDNLHKGEWDFEALANNFDLDFLKEMGFDEKGLNKVLSNVDNSEDDEFDAEKEAETIKEPTAKPGDVWMLGAHRVMCGDSTNKEDVERLMDGKKADMVFTDPPYNVAGESKNYAADVSKSMKDLSESSWDKGFNIEPALDRVRESVADNATIYVWTSHFLVSAIWEHLGKWCDHTNYCVWTKPNPMPSLAKRHWTWATELCAYGSVGSKRTVNFPSDGHALNWWADTKTSDGSHPTQKPISICERPILFSSNAGQLVLDLFLGSGSTLIACENTGRACYGMEIDPRYCDVIIKRWEKKTGKTSVKTQV